MGLELALLPLLLILVAIRLLPLARSFWRLHRLTSPIPGPRVYPVVGSVLSAMGPQDQLHIAITDLWTQYGSTLKLWVSHFICTVIVTDPADLAVVFNSPLLANKGSAMYDALTPMLGRGLITMNGPDYRRHRKAITASLHLEILKDFVPIFQRNAGKMVSRMERYADSGEVFYFDSYMADCANLNVCESVLSTDVTGMEAMRTAYVTNARKSSHFMFWRAIRPWFNSDAVFRILDPKRFQEYQDVAKGMSEYPAEILKLKIDQFKADRSGSTHRKRQTFLEHFLQSEDSSALNRGELLDELKTLMFGASETTLGLMSFFVVTMAENPEVQNKVQQELDDVFGVDPDRVVECSDLPHLQYLECVLKEVMRLNPPAPTFSREAVGDVPLPSGYTIPKGAFVAIVPGLTHRLPEYFPDPLRFDPDRFLPVNSRGRHPYAYIPFSAGSRSCIGQKYGLMFSKTVAATLLRRYCVLLDPNSKDQLSVKNFSTGITSEIKGGAKIRLKRRTASLK